MIAIQKNKEPLELAELRRRCAEKGLSPEEAYKRLKNPLKDKVRQSLIDEQGSLCAYCMCRIPRDDAGKSTAAITIEHIVPRNPVDGKDRGQGLDYNNLVAVCHGNRGVSGERCFIDLTCDAHRGNTEFRKVNPCKPETLESIFYEVDGTIGASDPDVDFDLVDTLNLNSSSSPLIAERKAALASLISKLGTVEEDDLLEYCERILQGFKSEPESKTPYVGILIWYLESMIKQLNVT